MLGASSGNMRAVRAAQLLDRGFANNGLSWLRPSLGTVDNLVPIDASPPNLRDEMCGGKHKRPASDEDAETVASNAAGRRSGESIATFFAAGLQPPMPKPSELLAQAPAASEPIPVYTGPTRTGAALIAAVAADSDRDAVKPHGKGKKTHVAAKKPDAGAEPKSDAKSEDEVRREAGSQARRGRQACQRQAGRGCSKARRGQAVQQSRRQSRPPSPPPHSRSGRGAEARQAQGGRQAEERSQAGRLTASHHYPSSAASIARGRLAIGGRIAQYCQNKVSRP